MVSFVNSVLRIVAKGIGLVVGIAVICVVLDPLWLLWLLVELALELNDFLFGTTCCEKWVRPVNTVLDKFLTERSVEEK